VSSALEHPHEIASPGRPETLEVANGLYAYIQPNGTWWINNTGCIVGPQGVFSIDTCSTERRTRAYIAAASLYEAILPEGSEAVNKQRLTCGFTCSVGRMAGSSCVGPERVGADISVTAVDLACFT
jgi:hypothetical protein